MRTPQHEDDMMPGVPLEQWCPGAILHQLPDALLITDAEGTVVYVNPAFERLTGRVAAAVIGRTIDEVCAQHGIFDKWRAARADQPWRQRVHCKRPDGVSFEAESAITPIVDAAGKILAFACVERDVTHLTKAQHLSLHFASDTLKELSYPLTRLRIYHSLLQQGKPEKLPEYHATLESQLTQLERMISNLGRLALLDRHTPEQLERTPTDVNNLVSQVGARFTTPAVERGLTLEQELTLSLPPVEINVDLMIEVLTHLVENAMAFTSAGGRVKLQTTRAQREAQACVAMVVADTGVGIPPEEQTSLFTRRFRGSAAPEMNPGGAGLGLVIVDQIVELHGGYVEVESEGVPGKGSTFTLLLPI